MPNTISTAPLAEGQSPDVSGAASSAGCLLGQLRAALGIELAPLSPRAVNLADRVPAAKRDNGRDEREHKRTDRSDDLQHNDDSDDSHDHDENGPHDADYRTASTGNRERASKQATRAQPRRPSPACSATKAATAAELTASGVNQQRVLAAMRDRIRPPAAIQADDRIHRDAGFASASALATIGSSPRVSH
ncbi:MAG: hypothetical protein ACRDKL_05670 [Solirubrobacteraceae bacterium]